MSASKEYYKINYFASTKNLSFDLSEGPKSCSLSKKMWIGLEKQTKRFSYLTASLLKSFWEVFYSFLYTQIIATGFSFFFHT